jgi:hypothetical protein
MAEAFFLNFAGCGNSCQINIYFFVFKNNLWRAERVLGQPAGNKNHVVWKIWGVGRLFALHKVNLLGDKMRGAEGP